MADIRFVTMKDAQRIHARQIDRFGGDPGVRDLGLLESALVVPCAYLNHLCKNHAFVDGNKRVALAVSLYFLARNGMQLEVDNNELQECVIAVASGAMEKDEITAYLRSRAARREG